MGSKKYTIKITIILEVSAEEETSATQEIILSKRCSSLFIFC